MTNGRCNGTSLCEKKPRVLHLGSSNKKHQHTINLALLKCVSEMLGLGFLVCNFDKYCTIIANKATQVMFNLFRALSTKDGNVLLPERCM